MRVGSVLHYGITRRMDENASMQSVFQLRAPSRMTRLVVLAVMAALCAMQMFALFPGYMSFDSAYQWWQARGAPITSLWPPGSTYLLWFSDRIGAGPPGVFILQLAAYWGAAATLALTRQTRLGVVFSAIAIASLPVTWIVLPHLWSDVQLALLLLWAALALDLASRDQNRRSRNGLLTISLSLLVLSSLFRHNAVAASFPIVVWWATVYARSKGTNATASRAQLFRVTGLTFLITTAILAFSVINIRAVSSIRADNFALTQIWDLQAISVRTQTMLVPREISENATLADLQSSYSPVNAVPMYERSKARWPNATLGLSDKEKSALWRAWADAVAAHPATYVSHRLHVLRRTLGPKRVPEIDGGSDERQLMHLQDNPPLVFKNPAEMTKLNRFVDALKPNWWASALVWIAAAVALVVSVLTRELLSARSNNTRAPWLDFLAPVALCASALLYLFSLAVAAPAADLRYAFWPCVAMALAVSFAMDFATAASAAKRR